MAESASRFAFPPQFTVVGTIDPEDDDDLDASPPGSDELTADAAAFAFNPSQARAPRGTPIGGRWIQSPAAFLDWITGARSATEREGAGTLVEHVPEGIYRPDLSEENIKALRESAISRDHIDENGEWTPERRAWQEEQVELFLQGVESQPEGEAEVWFNGGGPGSGKGSFTSGRIDAGYPPTRGVDDVTGAMDFDGMPNPGAALIDPDAIKYQFPEVQAMRRSQQESGLMASIDAPGGNWAGQSHEESSYMAKMIYGEAIKRNMNVVYDGTGTNIVGKAQQALDGGFKQAHANYMYVEADEALESAISRAGRIGRNVPPKVLSKQYEVMPEKFSQVVDSGVFTSVSLWDRNGVGQGQEVPRIFEYTPSGDIRVLDQAAYDRFLSSGDRVPDVGG